MAGTGDNMWEILERYRNRHSRLLVSFVVSQAPLLQLSSSKNDGDRIEIHSQVGNYSKIF